MIPPQQSRLLIGQDHCLVDETWVSSAPMYGKALEIVALIKAAVMEATGQTIESVRTLESGVVEEHATVMLAQGEKSLLFRMWPIFFTDDKRVEYNILTSREPILGLIYTHLKMFARANDARLVEK